MELMMSNSAIDKMRKVLIVDDNYRNIELAVSLLQGEDYEIAIAGSGVEVLSILEEFIPDLILLDVMMPEMDGYEVCRRLKSNENYKDIPVVFLTAKSELEDILQGFRVGGVDYIKKPFNQDELLMRVKTHVDLKKTMELVKLQNIEKSALLSITAHDLKNPLQAIWGLVDIIETKYKQLSESDMLEILSNIKISTKTAISITKDLLDLHRYESGKFNLKLIDFDYESLLKRIIEVNSNIAQSKNIKLCYMRDTEAITIIKADKSKFERIIDNLISNAIKFSEKNSSIVVKVCNSNNKTIISIKDEGPGFTEKDKELIFTKFAKLSAKPTGGETSSGLGLSIVKLLVEAMNGTVYYETEVGVGTEFFVSFPLKGI